MTLATNTKGNEALLFTLGNAASALKIEPETVLTLWKRGLFPDPVHFHPPLWRAEEVLSWSAAAASREASIREKVRPRKARTR